MSHIRDWQVELNVTIDWMFFATSHGKGVVDGIGGTLKNMATRLNTSEVNDPTGRRVDSAASFVEIIQLRTQITLKLYDEEMLAPTRRRFEMYENVPSITGIQGLHWFNFSGGVMKSHMTASPPAPPTVTQSPDQSSSTTHRVSDLVSVAYEDDWYIGEVQSINDDGGLMVKFMVAGKMSYRWSERCELVHANFLLRTSPNLIPCDSSCRAFKLGNRSDIEKCYSAFRITYFEM